MNKYERVYKPMKMDLQFFAEGEGDDGKSGEGEGQGSGESDGEGAQGEGEQGQGETSYSQSELDSAISKAVDSALAKREREHEKEKERIEENARKQGEEYAKLSKQEKEEAEYKERLDKLEAREKELNQKQLRSEVQNDLKENGLPDSFADSLVSLNDNDQIKKSIEGIKKTFDEAVNQRVKEQLRQTTPTHTGGATGEKNPFHKDTWNLTEQGRLYTEEPEKYKQLKAQVSN